MRVRFLDSIKAVFEQVDCVLPDDPGEGVDILTRADADQVRSVYFRAVAMSPQSSIFAHQCVWAERVTVEKTLDIFKVEPIGRRNLIQAVLPD